MNENMIINEIPTVEKVIAFTFDDGPDPIYTTQLLEIFHSVRGKATFFMIGEEVVKYPEIVRKVAEQGHDIGNHTFSHPNLSMLSTAKCLEEIELNEKSIEKVIRQKPVVFRPPYLDYNEDTISSISNKGYPPMIGALNLEARDWEQPGIDHILAKSRECVKNGSILIFHDGYGDRSQTIEAVSKLVSELTLQGYQFVTVSELLKLSKNPI
ncbi:peptidoglycan/xylan/chitin deacetylase (PgdA/CDA1 family) [Metabacillus crassostreae]|uniref:polysaccharide deacetylase family protein n=1 Tax=Metabacillus crassostreae TaxID=929098 RepID=UPI003B836C70|nr:peptidoglycan/xylan/chitin deacetylase (PgdA/CDA1 family) [Metabacillus crassostreae]